MERDKATGDCDVRNEDDPSHWQTGGIGLCLGYLQQQTIASALATRPGDPRSYFKCLDRIHHKRKGIHHPTTLHTDQGGPCIPVEPSTSSD